MVLIAVAGCGVAAWFDWHQYRIPNAAILPMAITGIAHAVGYGHWFTLCFALALLATLLGWQYALDLHARHREREPKVLAGAGDIKLLSVLVLLMPLESFFVMLLVVGVAILLWSIKLEKNVRIAMGPLFLVGTMIGGMCLLPW